MIRNVVTGRLRPANDAAAAAADGETLRRALEGIARLTLPGLLANHVGCDAGLRDGAWSFAITNDWTDADAYRNYDVDEEHNAHRSAIAQVCDRIARVQFEIADDRRV